MQDEADQPSEDPRGHPIAVYDELVDLADRIPHAVNFEGFEDFWNKLLF